MQKRKKEDEVKEKKVVKQEVAKKVTASEKK